LREAVCMDAILKRRSVRKFTNQDISDEFIKKLLAAGMSAPSAGNEQPWHFIVVRNKEALKTLSECGPYARALAGAPAGIVVCADLGLERHEGYWAQDCSACTENILIEAAALGLGAVWLSVYPPQDRVRYVKDFFHLPEQVIPFAMVAVGYPAQTIAVPERFNESRLHYEKW